MYFEPIHPFFALFYLINTFLTSLKICSEHAGTKITKWYRTGEMALWIKALPVTKPEDLSFVWMIYMMEGKNWLPKFLSGLHMHVIACVHTCSISYNTHTLTHMYQINKNVTKRKEGLERWLSDWEHRLLLQRTRDPFSETMWWLKTM